MGSIHPPQVYLHYTVPLTSTFTGCTFPVFHVRPSKKLNWGFHGFYEMDTNNPVFRDEPEDTQPAGGTVLSIVSLHTKP